MTLTPTSGKLTQEKPNSVIRLLATTVSFKILNQFADGTTQREQQEAYRVRPKQFTLCITGRKYMGGRDKTTLERKWKLQEMMLKLCHPRSPPWKNWTNPDYWSNHQEQQVHHVHLADVYKSARSVMGSSISEDTHHSPHLIPKNPHTTSHPHLLFY